MCHKLTGKATCGLGGPREGDEHPVCDKKEQVSLCFYFPVVHTSCKVCSNCDSLAVLLTYISMTGLCYRFSLFMCVKQIVLPVLVASHLSYVTSLLPSVRSTSSLASFCLHLKTHLFAASFPR